MRTADTETDAEEILGTELIDNVLYAVVSGSAGGEGGLPCPGRDIEVIMKNDHVVRSEFVVLHEEKNSIA